MPSPEDQDVENKSQYYLIHYEYSISVCLLLVKRAVPELSIRCLKTLYENCESFQTEIELDKKDFWQHLMFGVLRRQNYTEEDYFASNSITMSFKYLEESMIASREMIMRNCRYKELLPLL